MTKRDKYQGRWLTSQGVCPLVRWRFSLLLLLMMVGAFDTWAQSVTPYSNDYESKVNDWSTSVSGRYTPTIIETGDNHYMAVTQGERHNNGATLTNNALSGKAPEGKGFTLEFDMKIGNVINDSVIVKIDDKDVKVEQLGTAQTPVTFTVYDATNTNPLFKIYAPDKAPSTSWKVGVDNNTATEQTVTLSGTGHGAIAELTWYHFKISHGGGYTYVTITSSDGVTTLLHHCFTTTSQGGLGKMEFLTKRYEANFAFDNLVLAAHATSTFTFVGKTETYAISSEGDLPQIDRGKTISIEYGVVSEVQTTKNSSGKYGAYCIAEDKSNVAWAAESPSETDLPTKGTFYKLTPKYDGKLSISGWVDDFNGTNIQNNVTLQASDGSITATYLPTNSTLFTKQFDVELKGGETYYLYASTPHTANSVNSNEPILFLTGFQYEQTLLSREITVADLLYTGSTDAADGKLSRTIPGFTLAYNGDASVQTTADGKGLTLSSADGKGLTLSSDGSIIIALRQNSHEAKISKITLNVSEVTSATVNDASITTTGRHSFTFDGINDTETISCTAGSLTITSLIVAYEGNDNANMAEWLNEARTTTPTLSFDDNHLMRVPADGLDFSQVSSVSDSFMVPLTYASSNTSIATINPDGSNGQLLKAGEATITASFAGTDYFNPATATYTVSNVLQNGENYTRTATEGHVVRIVAQAAAADKALTLAGTTDAWLTYGTTAIDLHTTATATTVTLTNNSGSNITVQSVRVYARNVKAWLYYEGQDNNFDQQMHFQEFPSGEVKGFKVMDFGDPTDPIDLTSIYELKDGASYEWKDGILVTSTHHGGTFSTDNGSFTVSSKYSGEETMLPKVTRLLKKTSSEARYSGCADKLTATANIFIATPTDSDGDSEADTYKTWAMTTAVTDSGQMDSRCWTFNSNYYQTSLPSYQPVLGTSGTTLAGNEGLQVMGDLRYYTNGDGLRVNLTKVNARLKFPVKAGMEIKIELASTTAETEHLISNVTDIRGNAANTFYTETANATTTAYYLAAADGVVELRPMARGGAYIKRITLQRPRIHFNEEIVTVKKEAATITNVPYNTGDATLTYSIGGSYNLDGTSAGSALASIASEHVGQVTVAGTNEGYVTVNVTNLSATSKQPKKGSYQLYMIDFRFNPAEYTSTTDADGNGSSDYPSLDLSSSAAAENGGEALFDKKPLGADKVVQPVNYTMTYVSGTPRGSLVQSTNPDPKLTTYTLTAYSPGIIRVTATTGRILTTCDVTVTATNMYADVAPAIRLDELAESGVYSHLEPFTSGTTTYVTARAGTVNFTDVSNVVVEGKYYTKFTGLTGSGAIRVTATNNNDTDGNTSDDKTATFVLTVAYPASSGHKWNFYQMKNYDSGSKWGLKIGEIGTYDTNPSQTLSDVDITGSNGWTTADTQWKKLYRLSDEPRWAYANSVHCDNAFIIEETAGLQIETGQQGFYTDNPHQPSETSKYNHIGLHNKATVTIPRLKAGDYIALNLSRAQTNSGAMLSATNVTDLAGNNVNSNFTITRSQTTVTTRDDESGARVIPGYYTFRAAADGDVSFTLEDEGFLDILSIEIYDGSYEPTMTAIVTDGANVTPPALFLMDDGETQEIDLAICHQMKSTSVGPAEYVVVDKVGGLDATLENVEWVSDGGAVYNKGRITVNDSYGKLLVRMNNYTADGRYLTGYTPTYTLTVGHKPHQEYPFTWDFENISGGAVLGRTNNAASSISTDYQTWTNLGYETYQLDTSTDAGSLYVPGATLVTAARSLGEKGSANALNLAGKGNDEFNGLGFTGQIAFKLAQQGETANDAPTGGWARGTANSLLEYSLTAANVSTYESKQKDGSGGVVTWTPARLEAGDGHVTFGSPGKLQTTEKAGTEPPEYITTSHYAYRMDGGNTKNVLLEPQRPFQNGDIIHLTGYAPNTVNPQKSGFSFYAGATDAVGAALATVYFAADAVVDTEYTLDYTVKRGDGLAGRSQVYLCRADKTTTVHLSEVSITGDDASAPTAYERAVTCVTATTITIPDLTAGQYVYIKSSAEGSSVFNLMAAVAADGLDAKADGDGKVYRKYKVTANDNATLTFAAGTKVYRIGVTGITKPLTRVGSGDAWATESRATGVTQDAAIDYTQTGVFTVNDITANTVSATKYTTKNVKVKMNPLANAVPAETGVVLRLKLKYTTDDKNSEGEKMTDGEATTATTKAVGDFAKAKGGNAVPLFAPPHSATILSAGAVGFGGTQGNLMVANVTKQTFTSETETKDDVEYTRFIFAQRYMKWQKVDDNSAETTTTGFDSSGDVPVFYRMHLYSSTEAGALSLDESTLNTLGDNKAYMLIRSTSVPDALWKSAGSSAREFIGIEGVSEFSEYSEDSEFSALSGTYNLRGQKMDDDAPLSPGVYIRNGKKIVIK